MAKSVGKNYQILYSFPVSGCVVNCGNFCNCMLVKCGFLNCILQVYVLHALRFSSPALLMESAAAEAHTCVHLVVVVAVACSVDGVSRS